MQRYLAPLMQKIVDGAIDPSFLITHRIGLEQGPELYKTFRDKEAPGGKSREPSPESHPPRATLGQVPHGRRPIRRHRVRTVTTLVEISAEVARHALEVRHRCNASLHYTSPIQLMRGPFPLIEGTVHVFALTGYAGAAEASVWAAWAGDGAAITIHIVLHTGGIVTAVDAVRSIHTT